MQSAKNKALFLDRDGTINVDHGYVYEPERFEFVEGIFELCAAAAARGYIIIVASNQSGVSRGYYTSEQMDECNAHMCAAFRSRGITIADVFCATALDDADPLRKPNPGMFLAAIERHSIDPAQSIAIGDSERDALAAKRAGVGRVLLLSRPGRQAQASSAADAAVDSLAAAIKFL